MKNFTTIKVGYSASIYGCSGEYFITIYTTKEGLKSFKFSGLYGSEERVNEAMKQKGFIENYNGVGYGKITRKDKIFFWSETQAINFIKIGFKDTETT